MLSAMGYMGISGVGVSCLSHVTQMAICLTSSAGFHIFVELSYFTTNFRPSVVCAESTLCMMPVSPLNWLQYTEGIRVMVLSYTLSALSVGAVEVKPPPIRP